MAGRLRRTLFGSALVLGVVLVVGGAVVAYVGYERSSGPDGAVRAYFAALQDGNAPRALSWGAVPAGPHDLLTSTVLESQQRIAPIVDVHIGAVDRAGSGAVVHVSYALSFAAGAVPVSASVGLVEHDGSWRLRATAVSTQMLVPNAANRATVDGARVPQSDTLLFPGALPITLDTPYLELDPAQDSVGFGSEPVIDVAVQISEKGRAAVQAAVGRALQACLSDRRSLTCPLPSDRFVPGTLRGTVQPSALDALTITLGSGSDGLIAVDGTVPFTGTYSELSFANLAQARHGTAQLSVHARCYAVAPLTITWTSS
jgi:hypothetical protein